MSDWLRPGFDGLPLPFALSFPDFSALAFPWVVAAFLLGALAVAVAGVWMTATADRLADQTGLGEAVVGGVILGATTSLSGVVVSATAALDGNASLAFSNGVGGIAAQTAFLAVADLTHRRANLEHASAELANMFQASLLLLMLSIPMIAFLTPQWSLWAVHPASIALLLIYVVGVRATAKVQEQPMWRPVRTPETRRDEPEEAQRHGRALAPILVRFVLLAAVLATAGFVIARSGERISGELGISATAVGALMTAVATSLPELVTTIAAVRRGAVQLAVGGIIGGNTFDVLFLTLSDGFYREGAIYADVGKGDLFWVAVSLTMTAILLLGLLAREKRGPAGIGVESVALLGVYLGAVGLQAASG